MTPDKVQDAILMASEFITRATDALKTRDREGLAWIVGNKQTGAVKRASMDLTRALADMRRPN